MKLVTVATESQGYFPWLIKSCERFGVELSVLGWGEKWQGFGWRLSLVINYLEKQDPDEIVCFIDAYDVILLKSLEELEARFKRLNNTHKFDIIIGMEKHVYKSLESGSERMFGKCNSYIVNAGTYVGFASKLLDVIKGIQSIDPNFQADDQVNLVKYCNKFPDKVYVDNENVLFLPIVGTYFNNIYKYFDKYNQNDSCLLHCPLNGNMNNLILSLGYQMTGVEKREINRYLFDSNIKKLIYYFKKSNIYITILLLLTVAVIIVIYFNFFYNSGKSIKFKK